jgi:hypothetical protein
MIFLCPLRFSACVSHIWHTFCISCHVDLITLLLFVEGSNYETPPCVGLDPLVTFWLSSPSISHTTLFSHTINLIFSKGARDQVLRQYEKTDKIIISLFFGC